MNAFIRNIFIFMLFSFLVGCGGSSALMKPSINQKITRADKNMAKIVFMRPSSVLGAINAELFEIANGKIKLIGSVSMGNKIVHETVPGKKVYMAYGNRADFMLADVRAGKTYYSIIKPNWGTGAFAPVPVRTDGTTHFNTGIPEFKDWVNDTTLVEMIPEDSKKWFLKEKDNILKVYKEFWAIFKQKNANEKAQRTLGPQDGL